MATSKFLLFVGHTKRRGKSDTPLKSFQNQFDVLDLAMINHLTAGLMVSTGALEPSSTRLAEQCGVGHLAQNTVHLVLRGERPFDLNPPSLSRHLNKSTFPYSYIVPIHLNAQIKLLSYMSKSNQVMHLSKFNTQTNKKGQK